jgi:hypothetical protein
MNLLSALKSNGTGLLEGLCRFHDRSTTFSLPKNKELFEKVTLDFSIGTENLGTYTIGITEVSLSSSTLNGAIVIDDNILLKITFPDTGDFGRFMAWDYRP